MRLWLLSNKRTNAWPTTKATAVAAPDATPEAPAAADVEAGEDAATAPAVGAPEARPEPQKGLKLGAHTRSISFARSRILRLASPLRRLGSVQLESRHVQEPDPPPSWDRRSATVPSSSSFAPPAPTPAADEDHGSFEAWLERSSPKRSLPPTLLRAPSDPASDSEDDAEVPPGPQCI